MHIKIYNYMVFVVMVLCAFLITISSNLIIEQIEINAQWSAHTVSPGDPDSDGFYKVYTPGHLAWCAANNASKVKVMASLNLSEYQWVPFGTSTSSPWSGTFEGNGYEISGLTITKSDYSYAVAGLFGAVKNATIENIILSQVNISIRKSDTDAGAIVTYPVSEGTVKISNCSTISGSISVSSWNYTSFHCGVGGIVGYNRANTTITNCYNNISVTHRNNMQTNYFASAGGILGATIDNCIVTITGCSNSGNIKSIEYDDTSYSHSAGGILGYNSGSTVEIRACGSWAKIFAGDDESDHEYEYDEDGNYYEYCPYYVKNAYAGGIVGYSTSNLTCEDSFNKGLIESDCLTYSHGIVYLKDNTHTGWWNKVLNLAYWAGAGGKISLPYGGGAGVSQKNYNVTSGYTYTNEQNCYSGGICGYTPSTHILNCYNIGRLISPGYKSVNLVYPILLMSVSTFISPYEFSSWIGYDGQNFYNWSAVKFNIYLTLIVSRNTGDITANHSSCVNCYGTQVSTSLYDGSLYLNITFERANVIYCTYGSNTNSDNVTSSKKSGSVYQSLNLLSINDFNYYLNDNFNYLNKVSIYNTTSRKWQDYSPPSPGPELSNKRIHFIRNGDSLSVSFNGYCDGHNLNHYLFSTTFNSTINWTKKTAEEMKDSSIISQCLGILNWKIDPKLNDGYPVPKGLYY